MTQMDVDNGVALSTAGKTIAVMLYPGLTALDLVGPLQVLRMLERFAPQYRVVVVGERIEPMGTDVRLQLIPDTTFAEVPHPQVLLVPGGRAATIRAMSDPVIRAYVRTAAESAEIVASVCTGSLILGAVGLLEGRQGTTNWFFHTVLERYGATYHLERWVEDGKFLMSAGVSAGIDMALFLVSRLTDEATARKVQLALDYDPQPPFGRIEWDRVPMAPRVVRGALVLAAPVLVAQPKRLTTLERRKRAQANGVTHAWPAGVRGTCAERPSSPATTRPKGPHRWPHPTRIARHPPHPTPPTPRMQGARRRRSLRLRQRGPGRPGNR
jgi:putative intracellular protease/amidase